MDRVTTFFKEVKIELKKVTWPSREEATRFTTMVVVVSGVVAIFLGGLDFVFQYILNNFVL